MTNESTIYILIQDNKPIAYASITALSNATGISRYKVDQELNKTIFEIVVPRQVRRGKDITKMV